MIDYICPHCNQELHIKEKHAGQNGHCNKCGGPITVPVVNMSLDTHIGSPSIPEMPIKEHHSSPLLGEDVGKGETKHISLLGIVCVSLLGLCILYVGGWAILWHGTILYNGNIVLNHDSGDRDYSNIRIGKTVLVPQRDTVVLTKDIVAFIFNDFYYGIHIESRFFSSPLISWICLCCGIWSGWAVLEWLLDTEEEGAEHNGQEE